MPGAAPSRVMPNAACLGAGFSQRSNRYQVFVPEGSDVCRTESNQCLGVPRGGDELDVEGLWGRNIDDRTDVTALQPSSREIVSECDSIEKLVHELPREGNDESRNTGARRDQPDRCENGLAPRRPAQNTTDFVLLAVRAVLAKTCFARAREAQKVTLEELPFVGAVSQGEEDRRLESADRMRRRQQVIANLGWFDDGKFGVRQHARSLSMRCVSRPRSKKA